MRRKLAVLALLIAMFTSMFGSVTASACPIFMLPKLGGGCDDGGDRGGSFKDLIENIDW